MNVRVAMLLEPHFTLIANKEERRMDIQRIITAETAIAALRKLQDVDQDADFESIWQQLKRYQHELYNRLTPLEEIELDREKNGISGG